MGITPVKKIRYIMEKTELELLKERADLMGIKYHPNIGLAKLKSKLDTILKGESSDEEVQEEESNQKIEPSVINLDKVMPLSPEDAFRKRETPQERKNRLRKEAMKLMRVRVVCMNPAKKDLSTTPITIVSRVTGTFTRYVIFDTATHIETCVYKVLKEAKFTKHFQTKSRAGRPITAQTQEKEYAIEILPPLTKEELAELAQEQAITGRLEDTVD